jgi:hypothetical protein
MDFPVGGQVHLQGFFQGHVCGIKTVFEPEMAGYERGVKFRAEPVGE